MKFLKPSLIAFTLSATSLSHAYADVKVVTSIKQYIPLLPQSCKAPAHQA